MEKIWEHECALISHTMLSKTNTLNFYRKKSLRHIFFGWQFWFFVGFWIKFGSEKLFFWTNIEKNVFFNPIFKVLQIYTNCCRQHVRFVFIKIKKWLQKPFSWIWKKIIKYFAKKKVLGGSKIATLNTLKLFFGIPFWVTFHFEWYSILSDIPFSVTFYFEYHSIFNDIPFWVTFHFKWHSILSDIPFWVTFHF